MLRFFLAVLAISASFADAPVHAEEKVIVFAAASLREALDEVAREHEKSTGVRILTSYAASSALAKQIESRAPAQLFISADQEWMDYLESRKLIDPSSRRNIVGNRLVIIAGPSANLQPTIGLTVPMIDLLRSERIAVANPDHVPAGKYARAALESLGVWSSLQDRLVRTDNVRVALSLVSRGEAPIGIVYRSDAMADKQVRVIGEFARTSYPAIIYPAALTIENRSAAARQFLDYLARASEIFKRHGFEVLEPR
jgi:molybdate transport system substrate-binding protein